MDPLTQMLIGAAAAQAALSRRLGRPVALIGAAGGELADIDVLIRSTDPALPMEFHRHFTHALLLVPAVGVLAALPFLAFRRFRNDWKLVILAATIGSATHGLIDMCTSYGTYLLWPFVNRRFAWDVISIVDPIFTLMIVAGVAGAVIARRGRPAALGLSLCVGYLGLGMVQHLRAASTQQRLAQHRGHKIESGRVMPTIGNIVLWRSIYEADGRLYADAIRAGPFSATAVVEGASLPLVRVDDVAADDERARRVFEGLRAFADGFVARLPDDPSFVADVRYSTDPAGFEPLWGVRFEAHGLHWGSPPGVNRQDTFADLWRDITDGDRFE